MNTASTSTASLISSSHPSSSRPKNYEQAFGNLSSSFGFAGSVVSAPCVQNTSNSNRLSSWRKHTSSFFSSAEKQEQVLKVAAQQQQQQQETAYRANAQSLSQSQSEKKNFEAAYGDLASGYGFGGGSRPSRV